VGLKYDGPTFTVALGRDGDFYEAQTLGAESLGLMVDWHLIRKVLRFPQFGGLRLGQVRLPLGHLRRHVQPRVSQAVEGMPAPRRCGPGPCGGGVPWKCGWRLGI